MDGEQLWKLYDSVQTNLLNGWRTTVEAVRQCAKKMIEWMALVMDEYWPDLVSGLRAVLPLHGSGG